MTSNIKTEINRQILPKISKLIADRDRAREAHGRVLALSAQYRNEKTTLENELRELQGDLRQAMLYCHDTTAISEQIQTKRSRLEAINEFLPSRPGAQIGIIEDYELKRLQRNLDDEVQHLISTHIKPEIQTKVDRLVAEIEGLLTEYRAAVQNFNIENQINAMPSQVFLYSRWPELRLQSLVLSEVHRT